MVYICGWNHSHGRRAWEDGTFGATIGFQHLTGKFIEDEFEGTFKKFRLCMKNGSQSHQVARADIERN